MRLRIWGTRGSLPSPLQSEDIEAKLFAAVSAAAEAGVDLDNPTAIRAFISSLPHAIRGTAGGDTSCLEVRSAGNLLIFDCGSGLRRLGTELLTEEFGMGEGVAHVFITHTHWDHMMGWPYFGPAYIPGNRFYIYGVHPDLEARFRLQQTAPSMFPQPFDQCAADIQFITLQEGETTEIGGTRISNIRNYHLGASYGYRIEDDDGILVLSTDNEYKTLDSATTEKFVEFYRDADALIFDAMFSWQDAYLFEDWGHSSAVAGVDLATRAGARRLLLFHHAPASTDEMIWDLRNYAEQYLTQLPDRPKCEVIVAYDGFEMELWRDAKLETRWERYSGGTVIYLNGRLVGETSPALLATLDEAFAGAEDHPLVINLKNVTLVDYDGLAALFSIRRRWRPMALSCLAPEPRRTFNQAGALEYFAIYDTTDSALDAVRQSLELPAGHILSDRYAIEERVTRGPLGDLYLATDQANLRHVSVLVVCPSLGRMPAEALMKAARMAARLRHPMISDVFGAAIDGQIRFVVMEYTPGDSVQKLLTSQDPVGTNAVRWSGMIAKRNREIPSQAVHIGSQIAEALEYAHGKNTVHGGLKPDYVILLEDGAIKITNFCIGRIETDRPLSELPAHMGLLGYLAPEQLQGHENSPSSDLFSLGAILYEMLTGLPPFPATQGYEDSIGLQLRQSTVPVRRRNPNVSRSLEHLVLKLLEKSPQQRPANASAVRKTLSNLAPRFRPRPLMGRDRESEQLRHHLATVAQGESGFIIIHGQRGIGKTQLVLSALGDRVADQSIVTLVGELYAYEDHRPYGVFVEALRPALLELPAHRLSQHLRDLRDLSRPLIALMPQIRPSLSAHSPSEEDCDQLEQAYCQTLRMMTDDGPVVLILDSLQWIDAASLRLLGRLVRERIPGLLVVALYRTEQVDHNHPLKRAVNALEGSITDQLQIRPLGPIEVHQLASLRNTNVPSDFGLWLYSTTGGNPLHIEHLIQAYLAGPSETHHPPERSPSMTLDDAILRRLERLPDRVLVTLRQAAVLGHTFSFETLHEAVNLSERQLLAYLNVALEENLIVGHPSENRYRFSHPVIREVIYTEMLAGVRKRYHWRAAQALEREGVAGVADEKIDALAHHFVRSGDYEKAVTYLARGVRRARRLGAYEVALDYVNQALSVVEQLSRGVADEPEQRQKQRDDLLAAREDLDELLSHWVA